MMLLTCDPGDNTALVFWSDMPKPVKYDFFKLKEKEKKLSIAKRHKIMVAHMKGTLQQWRYFYPGDKFKLIIEGVSLWGGSTKSQTAAMKGDSFRLSYLVGGYITAFQEVFPNGVVEVVDVRTWKGSLPTPVLINEVNRFTGRVPDNEHIACAVGIGMHDKGDL